MSNITQIVFDRNVDNTFNCSINRKKPNKARRKKQYYRASVASINRLRNVVHNSKCLVYGGGNYKLIPK